MESSNSFYSSTTVHKDQQPKLPQINAFSIKSLSPGNPQKMSSFTTEAPTNGVKVHKGIIISDEPRCSSQSTDTALLLPNMSELTTHLKLIDAIMCLKNGIEDQAQAKNVEAEKAWDQFCRSAAVKFLEWSENVDVSQKKIPIPPLDILMIWHSYMLNTKDYVHFQGKARRGEMAGKGFDWQDLVRYFPC